MGFDLKDPDVSLRVVARNELSFAIPSRMPIVPGHMLVCPIRVVAVCDDLTEDEWLAILQLKSTVCRALQQAFGAEGFNFAWNRELIAGQTVPHFHMHIVPRKAGDAGIYQYEPRQFLYRPGSRAETPFDELLQVVELLRAHIEIAS